MPNSSICLRVATLEKCYLQSVFGTSLFLSSTTCTKGNGCLIPGIKNDDGSMGGSYEALDIFV